MPNSSSQFGQLQRAGVQRLITDRKGRTREGGPGSGRHKGTGMTDEEFKNFAYKVGTARVANRGKEDALRNAGNHEEANKIYYQNKATVGKMLQDANVHPKAFDDHLKQLSKGSGKRVNVKMSNMFPNWDSGEKESRSRESKRIRETISARAFMEQGKDEQSKQSGKKNRVYLVTIIEEGLGNSKDKNYYSKEALLSGPQVFNGAKAYCDHPDAITEKTLPERSMRDVVGWYSDCFTDTNPQTGKVRLRGKLHFFPDAKWLTDKIDTILTDPTAKNLFGISINAVGKTRPATMGGEEVNYVEQFQRVDSADVVTEPAARGKFDQMLESRRSVAKGNSRKVSISMRSSKHRTRESAVLSPEELKEVADSLTSAYNSDNPDETKEAAFLAAQKLYASSSISGKGPGQANEEQYSNINPSGGRESMAKTRVRASSSNGRRSFRKGKRHLQAAAGTGEDNEDVGEPKPSDIDPRLEEADVEDEEDRGGVGDQSEFGGGSKYHKVKAAADDGDDDDDDDDSDDDDDDLDDMDESLEDEGMEDEGMEGAEGVEGMEDEGMEGLEDEGMEDEDENFGGGAPGAGMPPGGGAPGAGAAAPAGGGAPGSSRTVASAEAGGRRRFSRGGSRGFRRRAHEADGDSGQGAPIKKASYAGGLGHSGHSSLPEGADPTRGYEDSDEDFGKSDDSTSGVGKSYKIKTSRFAHNRKVARVVKPVVREANRRIEHLSQMVKRLRESNRAKDIKINRYSGKLFYINSGKEAERLLREAVKKDILPEGTAVTLYPNLLGLSRQEQVREIKKMARFIESASEGVSSRLTESVEGNGARGGFVSRGPAGQDSESVERFAALGVPMKKEKE